VWVFDLDNTLHDADAHVFPYLSRSMTRYIQDQLGLDEPGAAALRTHYWQRYGATLCGLIRHHGTDPHHFLRETHDFPDIARVVLLQPGFRQALRRLPGIKVVFSNAPLHYIRAVLHHIGIARAIGGVFAIEHTKFRPKPQPQGFRELLARLRVAPRRCTMVEDSLDNLRTARKLGMRTLWVDRSGRRPAHVDRRVAGPGGLLRHLHRMR
jgi:putative hydrolase of the HAD superfamily